MTMVAKLPLQSPIRALRLHAQRPAAGSPAAERVAMLLDLGEQHARREAEAATVQKCIAALQTAIADLPREVSARLDEVAGIAVELGLAVAREVAGAALDKGLVDPTPTVRRCLRDCVHGSTEGRLVVRLNPDDLDLVQKSLGADDREGFEGELRFAADRAVPRGGVRAETDAGRLKYDPRDVLERIAAEVRREVCS